jgi:hypothetical protein
VFIIFGAGGNILMTTSNKVDLMPSLAMIAVLPGGIAMLSLTWFYNFKYLWQEEKVSSPLGPAPSARPAITSALTTKKITTR